MKEALSQRSSARSFDWPHSRSAIGPGPSRRPSVRVDNLSIEREPAIDPGRRPKQVARAIRSEEQRGLRNLFGRTHVLGRYEVRHHAVQIRWNSCPSNMNGGNFLIMK